MGLDFYLFEIEDKSDWDSNPSHQQYNLSEILYMGGKRAGLLVNWLYRNNCSRIPDYLEESSTFYTCDLGDLRCLISNINEVLKKKGIERDIRALHYFPPITTVWTWSSGMPMFTDVYYESLQYIRDRLLEVLPKDTKNWEYPEYAYQVSW